MLQKSKDGKTIWTYLNLNKRKPGDFPLLQKRQSDLWDKPKSFSMRECMPRDNGCKKYPIKCEILIILDAEITH